MPRMIRETVAIRWMVGAMLITMFVTFGLMLALFEPVPCHVAVVDPLRVTSQLPHCSVTTVRQDWETDMDLAYRHLRRLPRELTDCCYECDALLECIDE